MVVIYCYLEHYCYLQSFGILYEKFIYFKRLTPISAPPQSSEAK